MPTTEFAIRKAFGLIIASYSDDEIVQQLGELGVIPSVAQRVIAFVPLAFGRVLLAGTGITFADTYMVERGGTMVERPLDGEEVYRQAYAMADGGRVAAPIFRSIALNGAEVNAVNQALNAGASPENLVTGPPVMMKITDDTEPPKRKWWQLFGQG